jgi:hypothetical protein
MGGSDWETPTHQADAHYASSGENHQLLTIIRPVLVGHHHQFHHYESMDQIR